MQFNQAPPADLTAGERNAWDQLDFFYKKGLGYANEMSLRPQTLYGIVDSSVGLAAWMLDHDARSQEMIGVFGGKTEGLTRDDILDKITLYWVTNTAISSARLYWDTHYLAAAGGFFDVRGVKIPVASLVGPASTCWLTLRFPSCRSSLLRWVFLLASILVARRGFGSLISIYSYSRTYGEPQFCPVTSKRFDLNGTFLSHRTGGRCNATPPA